jgi:hypothetical protein
MTMAAGVRRAGGIALATAIAAFGIATTSPARAAVTCAATAGTAQPSTPTPGAPGNPCWIDYPFPFGADGNPVGSDPAAIAQPVHSLAFRAWNRGLAAVDQINGSPYTVWLFNGTRWYPDPTFPGPSVCSGTTVLWAGKLDYWLVGGQYVNGAAGVCRFDGVNYQWDPIEIPAASLARVPASFQFQFTLHAGACFAWNNCWFFGDYGVVDHWDGQAMSDASPGLGDSPWLQGNYTSAAAGVDAAGNPFALAVADASAGGAPLPPEPDGSPGPQAFASFGGAFAPLTSNPLAPTGPGPANTADLRAVATDDNGRGWIAGNPVGATNLAEPPTVSQPEPAPLLRVTSTGTAASCAGSFAYAPIGSANPPLSSWLWQALSVFPNSGAALSGGLYTDPSGQPQPGLLTAQCGQPPRLVLFRATGGSSVPADPGGYVTAVAANASNDAWAATTYAAGATAPPHLYRLTDGQPPDAPAGNDDETRPLVFQIDPTIYVQSPGVVAPPPTTVTTVTQQTTVTKSVKEKPAIYDVKAGKPVVGRGGRITLTISFKVRAPVTVGLEGLRGQKVVSSSGLRYFRRGSGHLELVLDRKRWPTRLKFITPHAGNRLADVAAPAKLTWIARIPA